MATKDDHQPTPWFHDGVKLLNSGFRALGTVGFPADAKRIVACVNACEGLPTSMLEDGIIRGLLKQHVDDLERIIPGLRDLIERKR